MPEIGTASLGLRRLLAFAALVVSLDVSTKAAATRRLAPGGIDLFPGVRFEGSKNSGVAFGLLSETGDLVVVVVLVALAGLVAAMLASRRLGNSAAAAGCVLGGGIANLGDRLGDGAVTAFIDIGAWPSFNLADTALTVGVVWWVSATARGQAEHGASRCI